MNSRLPYLCFIILGNVYLIFPTHNANIDSWYYAACVKHGKELINSHHLLYNVIGSGWYSFLKIFDPGVEAIATLNSMNAMAATCCLLVFYHLLLLLQKDPKPALWLSLFCGVSFGMMRYATDAETYILPLLFSLISTYFFMRENLKYHLALSALFSVIAILIHQLHLWWALAMFISLMTRKPFRLQTVLKFSLIFILVPIVYCIAFLQFEYLHGSFLQFICGEYSRGNASIEISFMGLGLTLINLLRSFIQVHGQIADIYLYNPILYTAIGSILIFLKLYFFGTGKFSFRTSRLNTRNPYSGVFLMAFVFHITFAFLSRGNAEFMVMLPFLLVLYLASKFQFSSSFPVMSLTILIFVWNMSVAIIPASVHDLNKVDRQVEFTIKHPDDFLLWKHKPLMENIITYKEGFGKNYKFIRLNNNTQGQIDSLVQHQIPVYTDFPNPGTRFSREEFVRDSNFFIGRYIFLPQVSWQNIYGENHIYLISKKGD